MTTQQQTNSLIVNGSHKDRDGRGGVQPQHQPTGERGAWPPVVSRSADVQTCVGDREGES